MSRGRCTDCVSRYTHHAARVTCLVMLLFLCTNAAAQEIRVEGIVLDEKNPAGSVALIDGQPVQAGETVGPYQVLAVERGSVRVRLSESGEEKTLVVTEGPPSPPVLDDEELAKLAQPKLPDFLKTMGDRFQSIGKAPGGPQGRLWELLALRDLAIINNAAVIYYSREERFPVSLDELVGSGLLKEAYRNPVHFKYRFEFRQSDNPAGFGIHAIPVDQTVKLRYFFVGTDAVIRESLDKPASLDSPVHEY